MVPCNECSGSGVTECPQCDGLGRLQTLGESDDVEDRICVECDGRRSVRCDACGGIGWLGADNVAALPSEYDEVVGALTAGSREDGRNIERLLGGDW